MTVKIYQVDAFTDQPFKGNPAAVCVLTQPKTEEWMQNVAAEMNLSETAFLLATDTDFSLRWFTPVAEVDLCGHATLASAHALWEFGYLKKDEVARFSTKSGILTAERTADGWIVLNFPSEPVEPCEAPEALYEGLGVSPIYVGKNRLDYLVELESEDAVKNLSPNWALLKGIRTRGIIVTSRSSISNYDFISRAFFPSIGINEDPVTGSAHCGLGPYWQQKLGKDQLFAYQASKRGGSLKLTVQSDRVLLGGQAVTVMTGEMMD